MKQRAFEERNAPRWEAFEEMLAEVGKLRRRRPLGERRDALAAFPERYREICRDLAVATERRYSPRLVDRLNRLTLEGHHLLYARDPNLAMTIVRFFARDFPRAVRRDAWAVGAATVFFLFPGILVWWLVTTFPELVYSVMGADEVRIFEAMYDPSAEHIGSNRSAASDVAMFGFYVFNNIGIAFRAYAGGMLFGLGSAFILLFNGIALGGVAAHIGHLGFEETFYSFVIGHGAFEMTAIVLSGAAGLRLGWSILTPGAETRVASLRRTAAETTALVWGVFAMLVVAAILEAFWSSKGSIPPELKFAVGGVYWALVFSYFAFVGRDHEPAQDRGRVPLPSSGLRPGDRGHDRVG